MSCSFRIVISTVNCQLSTIMDFASYHLWSQFEPALGWEDTHCQMQRGLRWTQTARIDAPQTGSIWISSRSTPAQASTRVRTCCRSIVPILWNCDRTRSSDANFAPVSSRTVVAGSRYFSPKSWRWTNSTPDLIASWRLPFSVICRLWLYYSVARQTHSHHRF